VPTGQKKVVNTLHMVQIQPEHVPADQHTPRGAGLNEYMWSTRSMWGRSN
jgi:hypothetical protein